MDWIADLEATCSNLGSLDNGNYIKGPDCLECVKDLIRYLRRDDENHEIRRKLGEIEVVQFDLIPLLKQHCQADPELLDLVMRLLVNLSNPELLLYREEIPEEKFSMNYFLQLQSHRQKYQKAFANADVWKFLTEKLGELLKIEMAERTEEDQLMTERVLILIRNILQVPSDSKRECRTDDDVDVHDQVLWVLHKSGMEDLLLYIASSDQEMQYCLHVLEIISLMLKEQDPSHLATANFQRSKDEKSQDERALHEVRMRELEEKRQKMQMKSTRHSRFGGTFVVRNVKAINDDKFVICHKPLQSINGLDFDKEKRPKKLPKNKQAPSDDTNKKRTSTLGIRLFLKEFCIEFLGGAYNSIMRVVKDQLNRARAQQNDETYYLWAMKFFMEFNRKYNFQAGFISETLSKPVFHYIQQQIELYKDNFEHEKRNRRALILWSRRMHIGLRAYSELLNTLVVMKNSKNEEIKRSADVLLANVFYEPEYRELCIQLFQVYSSDKMTNGFLKDLIETTHVFLKIMENLAKAKKLVIGKKVKKRKGGKKSKKTGEIISAEMAKKETKEELWDIISPKLLTLLQDENSQLPTVSPFDATLDISIDDQKVMSLYRIQESLKKGKPALALALLRASRDVWPEGEVFGAEDPEPEDEYQSLREILFADIKKPEGLTEENLNEDPSLRQPAETETANEIGEELNEEEEFESEGEEEEQLETYTTTESGFDLEGLVLRFATKNVVMAFGRMFNNYQANSDFTNHCIVKIFHRIAFDCKMPAILFQFSIFRTFQKINRDVRILPDKKSIKELHTFSKFILKQFFATAEKNKKVFMELCFWSTPRESKEIVEGYENDTISMNRKQKASYWSEEDEEKLIRFYKQYKEMEEKGESVDIMDNLECMFENKSRQQIKRKLKTLGLIKNAKELKSSRKPRGSGKSRNKRSNNKSGNISSDDEAGGRKMNENGEFLSKEFLDSDDSSSSDDDNARKETNNRQQPPQGNRVASTSFVDSSSSSEEENEGNRSVSNNEKPRNRISLDSSDNEGVSAISKADSPNKNNEKEKSGEERDDDESADSDLEMIRRKVKESVRNSADAIPESAKKTSRKKKSSTRRKEKKEEEADSSDDEIMETSKKHNKYVSNNSARAKNKSLLESSDEFEQESQNNKESPKKKKKKDNKEQDNNSSSDDETIKSSKNKTRSAAVNLESDSDVAVENTSIRSKAHKSFLESSDESEKEIQSTEKSSDPKETRKNKTRRNFLENSSESEQEEKEHSKIHSSSDEEDSRLNSSRVSRSSSRSTSMSRTPNKTLNSSRPSSARSTPNNKSIWKGTPNNKTLNSSLNGGTPNNDKTLDSSRMSSRSSPLSSSTFNNSNHHSSVLQYSSSEEDLTKISSFGSELPKKLLEDDSSSSGGGGELKSERKANVENEVGMSSSTSTPKVKAKKRIIRNLDDSSDADRTKSPLKKKQKSSQ